MNTNDRRVALSALWLASIVLVFLPAAWCFAQPGPPNVPSGPPGPHFRASEYWLGVVSGLIPDPVRAQLNLQENEGLLVEEVAPNSPAAAAKLERFDVLLKANGRSLAGVEDLISAVDAAKGQKLALDVIRRGKPIKVEVNPAKRPPGEISRLLPPYVMDPWESAIKSLQQMQPGDPHSREYSLYFMRPGIVLAKPGKLPDLPNNVAISVTKQGKDPVKIIVTRDNEKWELTEGELDKLPADLRPHVDWMLRFGMRGVLSPRREGGLFLSPPAPTSPPPPKSELRPEKRPEARAGSEPAQSIEKQLEEMNRRLDEMRKSVDAQVDEMRKAVNDLKVGHSKLPGGPDATPAPKPEPRK